MESRPIYNFSVAVRGPFLKIFRKSQYFKMFHRPKKQMLNLMRWPWKPPIFIIYLFPTRSKMLSGKVTNNLKLFFVTMTPLILNDVI